MDPRERLARLAQLKAEGDMIMQELIAAGMPPEQIMAAVEGGGQQAGPPMPQPGMGAGRGPDLPPMVPPGAEADRIAAGMNGGGMPRGLLGPG